MKKLSGKVALVTGASRGIGKAIAIKLAKEGAKVVINYNGAESKAKDTLEQVKEVGSDGVIIQCNVSQYDDVKKMVDYIVEKYGNLDILVNNAGITKDMLIMKMKEEQFDDVIAINLKGCFNCMQTVSKYMIKNKSGRIINISSVSGIMGNIGQANYSASKAGIIGMTKTVARELGSRKITVNAVAPGFINTEMTEVLPESIKEKVLNNIPMKSMGQTDDVANTVAFLASEDARYITGQVISVDGGMSM